MRRVAVLEEAILECPTPLRRPVSFAAKIRSGISYTDVRASPHGGVGGGNDDPSQSQLTYVDPVAGCKQHSCREIDRGLMIDGCAKVGSLVLESSNCNLCIAGVGVSLLVARYEGLPDQQFRVSGHE